MPSQTIIVVKTVSAVASSTAATGSPAVTHRNQ
jgi:hypothetical protein